jgi:hypothetical protein
MVQAWTRQSKNNVYPPTRAVVILFPRLEMPNNISKPLAFGEHAVCITNTSIHSFEELVDHLQLSLLPFFLTKLSLIIYIRKNLNGLPFWHSADY